MPATIETTPLPKRRVLRERRVLFVRMDGEMHQELTERAGAKGTSIAEYVRMLLEDALESAA